MTRKSAFILLLLHLSLNTFSQIPYAFRYQASVHNAQNRPINEEIVFDIRLFAGENTTDEVYREIHVIQPDINGIVAFSIGKGASNDNFKAIDWGSGPHYIQVLLDDEEISFSQLVSVPYAMHAATASTLYNLQDPVLDNDPSTKHYVDSSYKLLTDSITKLNSMLAKTLVLSKAYADSLAISPQDLEITATGDTLRIGSQKIVIAGMSSVNLEKYKIQKCLGGSYHESVTKSLKCRDGNIIILGNSSSGNGDVSNFKGNSDIWVIKLNKKFEILWQKTLGGSLYDQAADIIEENDGYLIAGTSESSDYDLNHNHGDFDIFLTKLDNNGNTIWSNNYGGSSTDFFNTITKLKNNNYLIGASTFSNDGDVNWNNGDADIWIFEIDNKGNLQKDRILGGARYDALRSLNVNKDATIDLYGTSSSNDGTINNNHGNLDIISIKLDSNLEPVDQKCYGTINNEQLTGILPLEHSTLMYGQTYTIDLSTSSNVTLKNIRIESTGQTTWDQTLGGNNIDEIIDIQAQGDTLIVLAQTSSSDGDISQLKGGQDIWIIKLSKDGKWISDRCIGGTYDESACLLLPWHSGWLVASTSASKDQDLSNNAGLKDIWLTVLDQQLNITWQKSYGGSYNETINNIIPLEGNRVIIVGTTESNDYRIEGLHDKAGNSSDIWLLNTLIEE